MTAAARAPAAAAVAVEGLSCRFGDFALEGISLRLAAGDYWVLLGPSGCGKTLLLQALCGFHDLDEGRVAIDGRDVTREPPERRGIGLVFQKAALFPHLDVRGNIEYGLRARALGATERQRRVEAAVAVFGLQRLLERPVATLSGGEAQRVAIARALATRPRLLLLDEPLSLVDHNARLELQAEIRRVHHEVGLTTLHVTHSRDEAEAMGNHLAVMLGGRVVQAGSMHEVLARPRCPFVAQFLGLDPATAAESPPCAAECLAH
ncbi:MAG: ATP-binding cassette domain-containing protein, partial [Deltaproteobacteria bacterium]|nr:ATP-binding cassette domain-containing protein [Deltaproteobacteria bacterium]